MNFILSPPGPASFTNGCNFFSAIVAPPEASTFPCGNIGMTGCFYHRLKESSSVLMAPDGPFLFPGIIICDSDTPGTRPLPGVSSA